MQEFIQKLPVDIVRHIIPYTYNTQNKTLLNDIVNYTQTKTLLVELYYNFWILEWQSIDPEEHLNWLINDIFAYANNFNPLMHGYIDKFYNIFYRNISLKSKEDVDKYVRHLEENPVPTQINIFLGLLTEKERTTVIACRPIRNR